MQRDLSIFLIQKVIISKIVKLFSKFQRLKYNSIIKVQHKEIVVNYSVSKLQYVSQNAT